MAVTSFTTRHAEFVGHNGAGAISVPGVKAGDLVRGYYRASDNSYSNPSNFGEAFVTVDDEIQQLSGNDESGETWVAILESFVG